MLSLRLHYYDIIMHMIIKFISSAIFIVGIILLYIFTATTPSSVGALGVLAVFLLLYLFTVLVITLVIITGHSLIVKLFYSNKAKAAAMKLSAKNAYYYSSIVSLVPVALISLRSVGQLNIASIALLAVFTFTGVLYVARQAN